MKTESQEQIEVFTWSKKNMKAHPELKLMFHIPNGGKRNIATASRLKLEGVKPGVPDIMLPVAKRGYHGLFIEMKRIKGGSLSPKQKDWFTWLKKQGYIPLRANGAKEAINIIKGYLEI